jgi:IclR family pca regulon transcriptional regulator
MPRLGQADAERRALRTLPDGVAPGDFSEALARGLRIIECFGHQRQRMTLAQVAVAVELPRATVRRALGTLVALGYMHLDGRDYELAPRVLSLASTYLAAGPGAAVLQPACEQLSRETGATVSVAVLDGDEAVMIARAAPNQLLNAGVGVGHRLPALHTSLGRVLLAALDDDALSAALAAATPRKLTPTTVTDRRRIAKAIRLTRTDGFAYVDREATPGFRSVAVPLRRWDGATIAAINAGLLADEIDEATVHTTLLPALQHAAGELSPTIV